MRCVQVLQKEMPGGAFPGEELESKCSAGSRSALCERSREELMAQRGGLSRGGLSWSRGLSSGLGTCFAAKCPARGHFSSEED